jgi:uncharacterized protein DUF4352
MRTIRAGLGLALFLSVVACGGSNTGTGASPATTSVFTVGQTIKLGDNLMYTVTSVTAPYVSTNQFDVSKNGQFLAVAVTFQNNGAKEVRISGLISFSLRDGNGQSYDEAFVADAPNPPDGAVAPGDKLAGTLVFDVPKNQHFKLYYTANIFSSGSVVVDLGTH